MESVPLEHENVIKLVLVTLREGVEEGRGFSNAKKDPMNSKELNKEPLDALENKESDIHERVSIEQKKHCWCLKATLHKNQKILVIKSKMKKKRSSHSKIKPLKTYVLVRDMLRKVSRIHVFAI
ncbi:hypothetical protein M9H77_16542 [Catharanthus roseus]|uniref:Uncharacterized protein n=1 Tax=Catharanthus roseus TaxID=4058 RepID=A0ACC0B227_CATRO|nr:hypothetical protein M9H77_16542 [Catharanthus roseus]